MDAAGYAGDFLAESLAWRHGSGGIPRGKSGASCRGGSAAVRRVDAGDWGGAGIPGGSVVCGAPDAERSGGLCIGTGNAAFGIVLFALLEMLGAREVLAGGFLVWRSATLQGGVRHVSLVFDVDRTLGLATFDDHARAGSASGGAEYLPNEIGSGIRSGIYCGDIALRLFGCAGSSNPALFPAAGGALGVHYRSGDFGGGVGESARLGRVGGVADCFQATSLVCGWADFADSEFIDFSSGGLGGGSKNVPADDDVCGSPRGVITVYKGMVGKNWLNRLNLDQYYQDGGLEIGA